jgi:hypothetical protein
MKMYIALRSQETNTDHSPISTLDLHSSFVQDPSTVVQPADTAEQLLLSFDCAVNRSSNDVSCQTDDSSNDIGCQTDDIPNCSCQKTLNLPIVSSQCTASTETNDSQLTDDSHYDKSYDPTRDSDISDMDCDDNNDQTDEQPVEEITKYLIFDNQLNKLFKFCPDCGSCIISYTKHISGTLLTVSYNCQQGHNNTWHSQPLLRRMSAGNLLLSAAILLSGSSYAKVAHMLNILQMPILSESEYYRIQNSYLIPIIHDYWTMHQTAILSVLSPTRLILCGDARSDSPGYSAKYSSYTIMDTTTSLILDQKLISLAEDKVSSSVAMEKIALEQSLDFLISSGIKIDILATDRHVGVQALMKQKYSEINHQFDVWHFSKNITKRLHKKALKKGATELMPWIHCISNHLYYCSQTCCGDPQLLKEKWMSCVHHTVNRHQWNGERFAQCEHDDIDNDNDYAWMTENGEGHKALQSVVRDKRLLTDMDKLTDFCHTGQLEVYHSMLLKYAPKRQHFQYGGMQARLQLAALDHNHNIDRQLAADSSGQPIVRQIFSKSRKDWILRQVYKTKEDRYSFIDDILRKVIDRRLDTTVDLTDTTHRTLIPDLKTNISTTDKPDRQDAIANRYSRMNHSET